MEISRLSWNHWILLVGILSMVSTSRGRPQHSEQVESPLKQVHPVLTDSKPQISTQNENRFGVKISNQNVTTNANVSNESRQEKTNATAIGESIKMVASQLLQNSKSPPPATGEGTAMIEDVRTPPKLKTQQVNKNKSKPSTTTIKPQLLENSHAGVAMPVTDEEIEKEAPTPPKKNSTNVYMYKVPSSTTEQGISTWILLSGSPTTASSHLNTKLSYDKIEHKVKSDDVDSKEIVKPQNKQKPKTTVKPFRTTTAAPRPIFSRRPVTIGSSNKADLIASGSAVNENVMNKIKATVLANVQKNKNASINKTSSTTSSTTSTTTTTTTPSATTSTTTTTTTTRPYLVTKRKNVETSTAPSISTTKKVSTTKKPPEIIVKIHNNKPQQSKVKKVTTEASPIKKVSNVIESKQSEIELEVDTPIPTTTKKPKRTSSKRKKNKNRRRKPATSTKKPDTEVAESKIANNTKAATKVPAKDKPITTQIYNYLSREVMPSVGVGLVSLAGLVGLASYFLYPFSGVVRRAYDTNDRKDDLYSKPYDLYDQDDGGQTEEEMLGKVLAGMPDNNRNLDPYITQTQFKYPQYKQQEQNLRYRNVAYGSDANSYLPSDRVGQRSPETIQGTAYSEKIHYDTHIGNNKDVYPQQFYPQPQPVYKAPEQMVHDSGYMADLTYSTHEKISDPIYGHAIGYNQDIFADTTKPPTMETLNLGNDDIIEKQKETGYTVDASDDVKQSQFVVGNVPKELIQAVTPVTVPEHGPRSLRIRRSPADKQKKSVVDELEKILKEERANVTDPDLLNEIDEALGLPIKHKENVVIESELDVISTTKSSPVMKAEGSMKEVYTVFPMTVNGESVSIGEIGNYLTTKKNELESKMETVTEKVVELIIVENDKLNRTEPFKPVQLFVDVTTAVNDGESDSTTWKDMDITEVPPFSDNESYDPIHQGPEPFSFSRFLRNLIQFKLRVGMHILQSTTESLARYLRGMESSLRAFARASDIARH